MTNRKAKLFKPGHLKRLDAEVHRISNLVAYSINHYIGTIRSSQIERYESQYILESIIEKLEEKV